MPCTHRRRQLPISEYTLGRNPAMASTTVSCYSITFVFFLEKKHVGRFTIWLAQRCNFFRKRSSTCYIITFCTHLAKERETEVVLAVLAWGHIHRGASFNAMQQFYNKRTRQACSCVCMHTYHMLHIFKFNWLEEEMHYHGVKHHRIIDRHADVNIF